MEQKFVHPLVASRTIQAQWGWIRVVAELHGVNREHPEILPARSLGTPTIEKTQQAPQVMSQWRVFLPELDQPGFEPLLHGLLQQSAVALPPQRGP